MPTSIQATPPISNATSPLCNSMPLTTIQIYQNLLTFIQEVIHTRKPGLRATLDKYFDSMSATNITDGLVHSSKHRDDLVQLASNIGLTNDPKFRHALYTDEKRIASYLITILNSEADQAAVLNLAVDDAECFIDVIRTTLDKGFLIAQEHSSKAYKMIRKLSAVCDNVPPSLFITGVNGCSEYPILGGTYSDIYKASYRGTPVAVKAMRTFHRGSDLRHFRSKLCQEAIIWKGLSHPNLLPLIGVDRESFSSSLCLVSPWMEHGNVLNYLEKYGRAKVNETLLEIAEGLNYLHSHNIVHGDLRGTNVLIDQHLRACITDIGLSSGSDVPAGNEQLRSLRWMAPELIDPGSLSGQSSPTRASDVYAFGCVCRELYTGQPLFANVSDIKAMFKIMGGLSPERPSYTNPVMTDALWKLVVRCWDRNHASRPTAEKIILDFRMILQSSGVPLRLDSLQKFLPGSPIMQTPLESTVQSRSVSTEDRYQGQSASLPSIVFTTDIPQKFNYQWIVPEVSGNRLGLITTENSQAGMPLYNNFPSSGEGNPGMNVTAQRLMPNLGCTHENVDQDHSFRANSKSFGIPQLPMLKPGSHLQNTELIGMNIQGKSMETPCSAGTVHGSVQDSQPEDSTNSGLEEAEEEADYQRVSRYPKEEVSESEDGLSKDKSQS
ncbi:kinase-like domain-containing protein [Mycena latifolia]|nr:kinase-like domain-containing protein [Mycena latifolia]